MIEVLILCNLHIILLIEYDIHIKYISLRYSKMQDKIFQVSILLAGLALIYIARYSSAKYNLIGRDGEGATMKVAVFKGISYTSRAKKNRTRWKYYKWNLGLYF